MHWNTTSGSWEDGDIYDKDLHLRHKHVAPTSRFFISPIVNGSLAYANGSWTVQDLVDKDSNNIVLDHTWSDGASYVFGVLCLVVASIGLLFNAMVIFSVIHNHQLRSHVSNVLICNLAVGSLLACIIMLSIEVPVRLLSRTTLADYQQTTCNAIGFVTSALNLGTIWTVVALSVDKCRSIDSPLRHSFLATSMKMMTYFFLIWMSAFLVSSFPLLLGQDYIFQPAEGTCDLPYENNPQWWYICICLVVTYYIPGAFVCVCHWRIFAIARIQSRRMATMVHLVTLIQVPLLNGRMASQQLSPQGRKAIYTTSIFVGTFILCYLPHTLVSTTRIFCSIPSDQIVISIATLLQRSALTVNIFIYGCRNRMVRDSFSKYVRRKLTEHASAIQWKRHDETRRSLRSRSIVRVDRPKTNRRGSTSRLIAALHPTRSQPILNTMTMTPLLHRALSLNVDVNDRIPENADEQLANGSSFSSEMNNFIGSANESANGSANGSISRNGISLDIIEEDQPLTINMKSRMSSTASENDDAYTVEAEEEDDACVTTPMLSPKHKDGSDSPKQKERIALNGLFPFSLTQEAFVDLKESVV